MRSTVALALVACCLLPCQALADITTSVKIKTYAISGDSGEALMAAMDRNGPRHGLLARAIAQTRYTVNWQLKWKQSGTACRLDYAHANLSIDYRYPQLARKASRQLERRWARFMAGVRKHEETHGRIARQMVAAAYRSVSRVSFKNDPSCRKAQNEVTRLVNATYAVHEERQRAFDVREHRDGGNVDRLVGSLIRRK